MRNAKIFKIFGVGLILFALTLSFGAVNSFAQDDTAKVGAVLKTLSNPFWVAMQQGLVAGANEYGLKLDITAVPTEQDVEQQLNQLETMLLKDYDVLLVSPISSSNLIPGLKKASEQDIPIIDLDGNLPPAQAEQHDINVYSSISSNNYQAGVKAAEHMIDVLNGEGKVIAVQGVAGNVTGETRVRGFKETIDEKAPGIEIVGTFAGDWSRNKTANITSDALTANPDLKGVYCANDTMALGAIEIVFSRDLEDQVTVIGTDGNSAARDSIRAGRLDASVGQLPYLMGKMAMETANKIINGQEVPETQDVPTLFMTQEVLEEGEDPLLEYVR